MTKILAFHLPQFHEFKENNKWWGDGFTEWVNVKKATKIIDNQNQPRIPLDKNYYNLLNYETRKWQADLAQKYNIYGFCYYHYWFNGKLLMEKPLELLLEEKDITLPFCFCWANEPWTRAWDGGEKDILIDQNYGDKEDWENHINYLMKFFKDTRYIKVDNRPMLVIYRTNNLDDCDKMITFWNDKCIENGFDGIYIVEERNGFQSRESTKQSKAFIEFEPMYTISVKRSFISKITDKINMIVINRKYKTKLSIFNYDKIWNNIIKRNIEKGEKKTFLGAFVDWDNTARKRERGTIFVGATPQKFEEYFDKQYKKAIENNIDYIFINAWNEWGEGTYLEPDESNKYSYLKSIRNIVNKYK